MTTIGEAIRSSQNNGQKVKGICLRSIKNGEVIEHYNNVSEMSPMTLSQATPGYIEVFGRVIIDVF